MIVRPFSFVSFFSVPFRVRRDFANTTIDAHCQRRAEREDESARAFRDRDFVHRFRQLLSDPRRAAPRAERKAPRQAGARSTNLQARSLQNEARGHCGETQSIAAKTKWSMK